MAVEGFLYIIQYYYYNSLHLFEEFIIYALNQYLINVSIILNL